MQGSTAYGHCADETADRKKLRREDEGREARGFKESIERGGDEVVDA